VNVHLEPAGSVPDTEGCWLVGEVQLYDSQLAEAAWRGVKTKLLAYTCAVLLRPETTPLGTGGILEMCLVDAPACENARILRTWKT
jgi:hypothetical protein